MSITAELKHNPTETFMVLEAYPARCRGIFLRINLLYILLLYGILYTVYVYMNLTCILFYYIKSGKKIGKLIEENQ